MKILLVTILFSMMFCGAAFTQPVVMDKDGEVSRGDVLRVTLHNSDGDALMWQPKEFLALYRDIPNKWQCQGVVIPVELKVIPTPNINFTTLPAWVCLSL